MTAGEAMAARTVPGELTLARPRWRLAVALLRPLYIVAAVLVYGVLLGGSVLRLALLGALLAVVFGWLVAISVASLVAQLAGPPPGLHPDGVRLRVRPWHRRLVTVPWSEITLLWVEHVVRRQYLRVQPDPRGPHADEWDPRGRRFGRRAAPLALYLPGSVPAERVRAAAEALSGGAVALADHGPDPAQDDAWAAHRPSGDRRRIAAAVYLPLLLAAVLIGFPNLLGVAEPWNRPWWPGVTAAAEVPDACGVFTDEQARTLGVTGRRRTADRPDYRECELTVPQGSLLVSLQAHDPVFFGSGAAEAAEQLAELAESMPRPPEPLTGVGDEARLLVNPPGTTTLFDRGIARVVARRANVVLVIVYGGEREPDVARTAVVDAARATLAGLDVR